MWFIPSYILSAAGRAGSTDYEHLRLFGQDLLLIWILVKHANVEQTNVWENIASTPLSDKMRSMWYRVIYDLIPTQVRLHGINIHNMRACVPCNNIYTLLHTLIMCTTIYKQWQWTHDRIAAVVCADPRYVPPPPQWLLLPDSPFGRK